MTNGGNGSWNVANSSINPASANVLNCNSIRIVDIQIQEHKPMFHPAGLHNQFPHVQGLGHTLLLGKERSQSPKIGHGVQIIFDWGNHHQILVVM